MKLLIVESPGKIKKLKDILGNSWQIAASMGHVRDLPTKTMGVEPPDFRPFYEPTPKGKDVLNKLNGLVKNVDEVYLAMDPDREGEAIAWHLKDALKLKNPKRVTYTSITDEAVKESIAQTREIDMPMVYAQEARRVLDRFCGYMVSGTLSDIVGNKLSAGRVQSPALRLVVDREKAIKSFVSTTHFGAELTFEQVANIQDGWKATWLTKDWLKDGEEYYLDKNIAENMAKLRTLTVTECEEKESNQAPAPPFTTSSLQQAASNVLKFDPKKTMELAQGLYEGGHITYMRTDSPNLSKEAERNIRAFCDGQSWELSDKPRHWKSKSGSQEAHEAIRPTHLEIDDRGKTDDEKALYKLIRLRTLASQLADAVYAVRIVRLEAMLEDKIVLFEAKGRTLIKQGWKVLVSQDEALSDEDDEVQADNPIPDLKEGSQITALSGEVLTKKTKPPARFTLAALVRELEKRGIGRPATYASILDNIVKRQYIKEEKRKLHSTELGDKLISTMTGHFDFLDYDFTKNMEQKLDDIAEGKADYKNLVAETYNQLAKEVNNFKKSNAIPCPECKSLNLKHIYKAKSKGDKGYDFYSCPECKNTFPAVDGQPGEKRTTPTLTDFNCDKCQAKLKHIKGQKSTVIYNFFACSNEKCKKTYDNVEGKPTASEPREAPKQSKYKCKKCNKPLFERPTKTGGIWFSCSNFKNCKEKYWANEDGTPKQ